MSRSLLIALLVLVALLPVAAAQEETYVDYVLVERHIVGEPGSDVVAVEDVLAPSEPYGVLMYPIPPGATGVGAVDQDGNPLAVRIMNDKVAIYLNSTEQVKVVYSFRALKYENGVAKVELPGLKIEIPPQVYPSFVVHSEVTYDKMPAIIAFADGILLGVGASMLAYMVIKKRREARAEGGEVRFV